eukprot:sb/3466885/
MSNILNSRLEGYTPTIDLEDYTAEDELEDIEEIRKELRGNNEVSSDWFREILFRDSRQRNKVLCDEEVLDSLVKHEEATPDFDLSQLKEALNAESSVKRLKKCLGNFPEFEKRFLKNMLEMGIPDEEKFKYLEEGLCTVNREYLDQYKIKDSEGVQLKLNKAIISASQFPKHPDIQPAIQAILNPEEGEEGGDPFIDKEEDAYKLGTSDLRKTFHHCYSSESIAQRLCTLKGILQRAIQRNDKLLLFKFICSHASKDLGDIFKSFDDAAIKLLLTPQDEQSGVDLSLLKCATTKEDLLGAMDIKGFNLKQLIVVACRF